MDKNFFISHNVPKRDDRALDVIVVKTVKEVSSI